MSHVARLKVFVVKKWMDPDILHTDTISVLRSKAG